MTQSLTHYTRHSTESTFKSLENLLIRFILKNAGIESTQQAKRLSEIR